MAQYGSDSQPLELDSPLFTFSSQGEQDSGSPDHSWEPSPLVPCMFALICCGCRRILAVGTKFSLHPYDCDHARAYCDVCKESRPCEIEHYVRCAKCVAPDVYYEMRPPGEVCIHDSKKRKSAE